MDKIDPNGQNLSKMYKINQNGHNSSVNWTKFILNDLN